MKIKKLAVISLTAALAVMVAAGCGKKDTQETTAAAAETTAADSADASPSEAAKLTEDDPELQALENMEVPQRPSLKKMGTVELANYTGVEVTEQQPAAVTDEDIIGEIQSAQAAEPVEVTDRKSQEGDTVNIDYVGKMDGKEFEGGSAKGTDLKLGSGTFIDGFEKQLEGHAAGDKVTVNVTFPENYSNKELAGKPAVFEVIVNKVSQPAPLTEEFIKAHAKGASTEAEWKAELRAQREEYNELVARQQIAQDVLSEVVKASAFTISDEMKAYTEAIVIHNMLQQYKMYGMTAADVLNMYGMSVADFKKEISATAEEQAKQQLALAKIADEQKIKASSGVYKRFASQMSALYNTEINMDELVQRNGKAAVEEMVIQNAVMDYLADNAKVSYADPALTTSAAGAQTGAESSEAGAESAAQTEAAQTESAGSTAN